MKLKLFRGLFITVAMTVASAAGGAAASAEPLLHHVHGLAFTPDGAALLVPAHFGLAVYRDGRWSRAPGAPHDLMGFSVASGAIYSSGHPALGSPLRNPLGLVKSTDGGKTWQQLSVYGEADFHEIAVGYQTGVVYVISASANSQMPEPWIYYTRDEGKTWKSSDLDGINSPISTIAAHPSKPATVALGTVRGLYLSRDFGQRFRRLAPEKTVTAVFFELDGKHLLFASEDASALVRVALDGSSNQRLKLPAFASDVVTYIAQNPANRKEIAIATRRKNVFLSPDAGKSWKQIAREGEGL